MLNRKFVVWFTALLVMAVQTKLATSPPTYINSNGQKEISEMNLLIPVSLCSSSSPSECRSAKHELFAYNGCYEWTISHPHIIEMTPGRQRGECVDSVILRSQLRRESKTIVWITARDKSSGQVLETQAKVGVIDRLAININYKHLYINDKKHIDVVAYDDEGNIFSSLDGFLFDWRIVTGSEYIKVILRPEGYSHKRSFDGTDVSFVRGLKSGASEISVQILEPGYEQIQPVLVTILVVDPFIISPAEKIYMLPSSRFDYSLLRLKKQDDGTVTSEKIVIPSKQYNWSVLTPGQGTINQDGAFVSGVLEASQTLLVVDQKMVNNTAEADLQIVYPYRLEMSIHDVTQMVPSEADSLAELYNVVDKPTQSRVLVENHSYLIVLTLFDKDSNRITLTDNVRFGNINLLDSNVIEKKSINKIGSEILFKTRSIEKIVKLQTQFTLQEIKNVGAAFQFQRSTQLTVDAELVLTKPVQILHPTNLILLPFIENGQVYHTSAVGGSGVYEWKIQDPEIATIENSVTIKSVKVGRTKLWVSDLKNSNNRASIDVEVAHVAQLQHLEAHMELYIDREIGTINVIALDTQQRKFSNCTSLNVKLLAKGEGVQFVNASLNYNDIQTWLQSQMNLIRLKQKFDENPSINDVRNLPSNPQMTDNVLIHNNFGICAQSQVRANVEGLARVQSVLTAHNKAIQSEFAEIGVFKQLETAQPQVDSHLLDLHSLSQVGNEFASFSPFSSNTVLLAPGTEIIWSVKGGTNFWKDYSDKYSVTWFVTTIEGTNCLQIAKHSEQTTVQNIKIRCNSQDIASVNKLTVNLLQSSKQSRQLLQPARHNITINVECGAAKSTRLLWAQQTQKVIDYLPNSRTQQNERLHFVQVNSKHYVKSVFFNAASLAYYNSSSIVNKVTPSDQTLATVIPIATTFDEAVQQDTYNKKVIQFANITGTVVLLSTQSAYINSLLQPASGLSIFGSPKDTSAWNLGELTAIPTALSDQMKIQIVNPVSVSPPFKSVYLGSQQTFTFQIQEGSGYFTISLSDNDIALVEHKDREIVITPKSAGLLQIKIEDVMLPGSEHAIAQVLVSDIEKLYLWAPSTLMEQGDELTLVVNAFDSQGNNFDEDQYINMLFGIETEMTGVIRKHGLKTVSTSSNIEFRALGIEPGIYQLTAYTEKVIASQNVVSEMIRVEVFPILEIVPTSLLITPNMKYTLQIFGGPQTSVQAFQNGSSIEVKFEIDKTNIASVDANREVTGIQVGDATLRYTIVQQKANKGFIPRSVDLSDWLESRIVSKKSVPIRVRLVTDVEIPLTHQRQIYIGSLVKLNVVLKHENEYFNHGIAPISYAWNCTSQRILTLELPSDVSRQRKFRNNLLNDDNAQFITTFNSSSIYAQASKEGDAQLTVQLAIEYPQKYRNQKNWFTQQATVKVAPKLKIQVNEFSTQSSDGTHMYLIPPNSIGHISTNIDTKLKLGYSVVSVYDHSTHSYRSEDSTTPLVKLIDNKAIQTFDKYGKVTVVVEQGGAQFSDQVAMLNVFISDIYSLQVMNTYDTVNLPLGSNFKLPIHFQNEHAVRFANNVQGIEIGYSVSHPKVVTVSIDEFSQTLNINSQGSGDCNIYVFLVNRPQIFDIIKVKVSSIVRPNSPVHLHLGGVVEFKVINPDDSKDGVAHGATWKSSEPGVLQIDSTTGKALAYSEGKAEVLLSNHINAASIVHVSRIQFGQVEQKNGLFLNTDEVSLQGSKYQAPDDLKVRIKMFLTKNGEEVMPTVQFDGVTLIKQNIGITCATDQPDFVIASGEVSDLEGFFCVLRYNQDANHKSMPRFVKVTVNAFSLLQSSVTPLYSDQIAQFEVQLLSSIKVEKNFMNGVKLSKAQRSQSVQIFSSSDFNTQIDYVTKDDTVMLKQQVTRSNLNSNDYNLTVIVPSDVTRDFQANIILTHPYTKFQRSIPVQFDYRDDQPKPRTRPASKQEPEYENMKVSRSESSWSSYIAVFLIGVATFVFIMQNWFNADVLSWLGFERPQQRPARARIGGQNLIRDPRSYPIKNPNFVDSSFLNDRSNQSQAQQDRRPRQIPSSNLDRVQQRGVFLDRSGGDPSQKSLFQSSSSRF